MSTDLALLPPQTQLATPPRQADADHQMVAMWVHRSNSKHTRRNYQRQATRFLAFVGRSLAEVRVLDVQAYLASLEGSAPATRAMAAAAVKSLLKLAHETGYIPFNPGVAVRRPPIKGALAERILTESDVQRMIHLEPDTRNRVLLTLLYAGALRVSELAALKWRDLQPRDTAGQITIFGKGGKTRAILLSAGIWNQLTALRGQADQDGPVFKSRKGGALDTSQVWRIVKAAALRAGINPQTSCHWLRHAHASHALDRGCPIHLVQQTLGHASVATTGIYLHARPADSSTRYLGI